MKIPIVVLEHAQGLALPRYETEGSAGMDLKAATDEGNPIILSPGKRIAIPTGLKMAIPIGWELQIRPRSGLALKDGVTVLNSPGTIDSDFRGEIHVILKNQGEVPFSINRGDRIAQVVLNQVEQAEFEVVEALDETVRGEGSFGSTGTKT